MDNFITLDFLSTFGGMVTVVVLITEFTKDLIGRYTKGLPTKYIVFLYSLLTILSYQIMSNTFNFSQLFLTFVNAIVLTMTAQGAYEWTFKPIEQKVHKGK
jgi:hypothetical protein